MALEGLLANLLALPSTLDDQQQQNSLLRSALGPQTDVNGNTVPGLFTPQQLQMMAPDVGQFPGRKVPVLGQLLHGIGETGQLLQTALGTAPDAPRLPVGTFVQIQALQSKQAQQQSLLGMADQVAPEHQDLFKQLVHGGDLKTARSLVPSLASLSQDGSPTRMANELGRLKLLEEEGTLTDPQRRRMKELQYSFNTLAGVSGDRAMAGLPASYARAEYSAGLSDANRRAAEERAAKQKADEDAAEQQRKQQELRDFRERNRLPGAGGPAGVPVRPGMRPVSLLEGDNPLDPATLGTDPLATSESTRTESPTNLSITRVTPRERLEAIKALRETGTPPENPDGSYSEAQLIQYQNAVKGSGAAATALGGLTPPVVDARAQEHTALGRAEVLSLDEALAWGVSPGTTVGELRELADRGKVTPPVSGGNDAESQKELRRIRAGRTALAELVGATDQLTTNPAVAISRLQSIGLEWSRVGGNLKSAQIAAASMIAPTLRKAFGDTGNMGLKEQEMTMDAVIPNSGDTDVSARNKLLVMDNLLALMESSVTGKTPGPGVKEAIIQMVEGVDPHIREKLGVGRSGVDIGDGFTVELVE